MTFFEIDIATNAPVSEKGRALAQTLRKERALLILDGVEPLQYPPGPMGGQLKGPGLKAMLQGLARGGHAGLVLITTREELPYNARKVDLNALTDAEGARLLHALGVTRAGGRPIGAQDRELKERSRDLDGHSYSLGVLGRWIRKAFSGDVRAHPKLATADARAGGHGFRVIEAYDAWLGAVSAERQALRLLGLFDRPANAGCLAALRAKPAIPG